MRTKHILAALAVPALFTACTQEQFEIDQPNAVVNRPVVGQVTFVESGAETRVLDPVTGKTAFKDGDKFGMMLMDEVAGSASNADIDGNYYTLVNKAYTNYPFTKSGDVWRSEAQLVEGNYFYYMPYTDNQRYADRTSVSRAAGLTWVIPSSQNAFTDENPSVLAPYASVEKNQLYVGYANLSRKDAVTTLDNKMVAAHATLGFKLVNNDASSMVIKRIVLEYKDGTQFYNGGILNVASGKVATAATGVYTVIEDGNEVAKNLTTSNNLSDVFKFYNADVKGNRNDYTKNPLMLGNNTVTNNGAFVKGSQTTSSIALKFPGTGTELASGQSATAFMVVPAKMSTTGLRVRIYTNKGVVLLPLSTANCTTKVAVAGDSSAEGYKATGDVMYAAAATPGDATATVKLQMRNDAGKSDPYKDKSTFNAADVLPNAWNVSTIGLTGAAIQIPRVMDIYSNEDLDAFLGYCLLNPNLGEEGVSLAGNIKSGVTLSKEAYSVLENNEKVELTIDASAATITIPATIEAEDVLTRIKWANNSKVIVYGEQTIAAAGTGISSLIITNYGTLTTNYYNTANPPVAQTTTVATLYNLGTVNVKTPLTATTLVNGYTNTTLSYDYVTTSAELNAEANVTANTKGMNIATINVKNNITLSGTIENNKVSKARKDDKLGVLVVEANKTLTTEGTSLTNDGTITVNGILTANATLTNNGTINNNFGLENIAGENLTNAATGKIVVAADAHFTTVTSNAGEIEIKARDTEINVSAGAGVVSYSAVAADIESGVFTMMETDAFNTLKVAQSLTINPELTKYNETSKEYELSDAMKTVLNVLTLKVNETANFRFHKDFYANKLEVAKDKYMTVASDVKIKSAVTINTGATIQNNRDCKFTYNGTSDDFVNGGTFRNIGTVSATSCSGTKPAGTFTGSGTYDWGTAPAPAPAS